MDPTPDSRISRLFMAGLIAGACLMAAVARSTPEAATWRRQTLVGQNQECFFRYLLVSVHPGFYYSYLRTLRLEKVRKSDAKVVESFVLRDVAYSQDVDTERWSEAADSLPPFDLPRYLRANRVALAFPNDLIQYRTFAIDSAGVWEVLPKERVQLATRRELERQIPMLGDNPRVVGIEETGGSRDEELYLRIESGTIAWDADWSEDLLVIPGGLLR
jgi:hypothetical protein